MVANDSEFQFQFISDALLSRTVAAVRKQCPEATRKRNGVDMNARDRMLRDVRSVIQAIDGVYADHKRPGSSGAKKLRRVIQCWLMGR